MTIFILDHDPKKIAEMLDDKSLTKMIKDVAQVLCDAHEEVLQKQYNPEEDLLEYPKYAKSLPLIS